MTTFSEQLAATRANLGRVEKLFAEQPDLFEHGHLIDVKPERAMVFLHASRDRNRDWREWLRVHHPGVWLREESASSPVHWDYRGQIGGVGFMILQAEPRPEPQPLFAEEGVPA